MPSGQYHPHIGGGTLCLSHGETRREMCLSGPQQNRAAAGMWRSDCTWGLLEAIEGAIQLAHVSRMSGVLETSWLCTIDSLGQSAMKEGILHVKLMDRPLTREGQRKHCADGSGLHNWVESLGEVNPRALCKSSKDPTRFVALQ